MKIVKKMFLCAFLFYILHNTIYAGLLSGNSTPYVGGKGLYAFKLNTSIVMFGTPFSSVCLTGKYGYDDILSVYARYGVGTIDYSTVSGTKLTTDPQISSFGIEYLISGTKTAEYYAFVSEYETVSWSINKQSNSSNEILMGLDYSLPTTDSLRTRYRIAIHNFYAGTESQEKISTSVKYSLSTEIDYSFSKNIKGSFEANMYFGDTNGIISCFGLGLGYNI